MKEIWRLFFPGECSVLPSRGWALCLPCSVQNPSSRVENVLACVHRTTNPRVTVWMNKILLKKKRHYKIVKDMFDYCHGVYLNVVVCFFNLVSFLTLPTYSKLPCCYMLFSESSVLFHIILFLGWRNIYIFCFVPEDSVYCGRWGNTGLGRTPQNQE